MDYGFKDLHPLVQISYILISLIAIMALAHPLVLIIIILSLSTYMIKAIGWKDFLQKIKAFLFLSLFIVVINPLFNQRGQTIILEFQSRVITLEALSYGLIMAMSFIAIIILFQLFNLVIDSQRFLYVFAKIAAKSAFLANMALRYIPLMRKRFQDLLAIKLQGDKEYSLVERTKLWGELLLVLISWSFEEAIITADSMQARGYGYKKRTNHRIYKWTLRDYVSFSLLILIFIGIIFFKLSGLLAYRVYPSLAKIEFTKLNILGFTLVLILAITPQLIDEKEKFKWRNLE